MVHVRPLEAGDVPPANALTNWYIEHTAVHFALEPSGDDEFAAVWQRGSRTYPWLAAEVDGSFAGFAKAAVWREREAYQNTCEVGIYIARGFEGKGVGTALYRDLLDRLRAAGFHTVIGGMTLPNDASAALHERMGFAKVAHFERVGRKFDQWHDVGFWQLHLAEADAASGRDA
ncbi:MAG: N-acetyltransferase family protein [Phycisphaerales bacterium]|nr:N-acetyltransferase family protein [Phycisphaerales bacterium]